ncbi:MAG: hypothetical protein GY757_38690 [bacterium]|nr:hypothetical protein [bacterium]
MNLESLKPDTVTQAIRKGKITRKALFMVTVIALSMLFIYAQAKNTGTGKKNGFSNADYAQHMMKLRKKIPGPEFTVILQKPFVVISDETPETVKFLAENIVQWAVKKIKHMYFKKNPTDIIDIWLFNGKKSYRKYTREIFGDSPETPFGYSSSRHKALIMNIRTGTGTLVHELVHPFIRSNFPTCPSWFNEGLASLYEQCTGKDDKIVGLLNWRLPGLQEALKNGVVPSFRYLTATSEYDFYEKDPGTNYAQARYLCYYLQEKGLLVKFYRKFHSNWKTDPTGYKSLKAILGITDMKPFRKKWEQFVLNLKIKPGFR